MAGRETDQNGEEQAEEVNSQPHESKAKQSIQYYACTSTQAEEGDQDGDWTKRDKISVKDETTSMYFLVIIWLWLYNLSNIFKKYFLSNEKRCQTQYALH